MCNLIRLLSLLAVLCATAPAAAELYKWVDERGVTNYSNEPPPAAATAKKLTRVENKISVYTPDEGFMQAVKALRERSIKALSEPAPPQVAYMPAPPQTGYEKCLLSGRLGCEDLYGDYYPGYYPGAVGMVRRGVRPTRFLTPHLTRISRGMPR
jgi:hypothetical protein